jgi:hypothetical protein
MSATKFGTALTLVLGCTLLVGALVFLSQRSEELHDLVPRHNPKATSHVCEQKARLMRMLRQGNTYAAVPQ